MRLIEIDQNSGEEARVKRLKDNAKQAKVRAKQLSAQADLSAHQLKAKKAQVAATAASIPVPFATGKPSWDR